jgi:hypothetical protein
MLVHLLLNRLELLDYLAAERPPDPSDDRARVIQVLMRWRATMPPEGIDPDEVTACLDALGEYDRREVGRFWERARSSGATDDYDPRLTPEHVSLRRRFGRTLTRAANAVTVERTSERELALGDGRDTPVLILGEKPSLRRDADRLERELGGKFLGSDASPAYRAARARKWKQLALAAGSDL